MSDRSSRRAGPGLFQRMSMFPIALCLFSVLPLFVVTAMTGTLELAAGIGHRQGSTTLLTETKFSDQEVVDVMGWSANGKLPRCLR
jgi:hypothetical protein